MPHSLVHVIINPKSGGGRGGRMSDAIRDALQSRGVRADIHHTTTHGHAAELARGLAAAGADAIVAAGGDGTVHDVANGILRADRPTALGVLPVGTGNDFAKVVPGAATFEAALDVIAQPRLLRYDTGRAWWDGGDEFFVNGMGTGIDVEVVRQILTLPNLPGAVKYLLGLLKALAVYQPISLSAQLNGERLDRTVMMMAIGNGVCQGGGFYLTPQARPDDGRLELCVIDQLPLWRVPAVLPRVLRGTHGGHAAVTMRALDRVRFEAAGPAPLYFQLDGELREPRGARWLDVAVQPGALNVMAAMETIQ